MQANEATDELVGPPRLARWLAERKAERERRAALAVAGVTDAAAYEEPGLRERMIPRRSSNALTPVIGLREQLRRASEASHERVSTSDEEDNMPLRARMLARMKAKRTRSFTSSGRTAAAIEVATLAAAVPGQ